MLKYYIQLLLGSLPSGFLQKKLVVSMPNLLHERLWNEKHERLQHPTAKLFTSHIHKLQKKMYKNLQMRDFIIYKKQYLLNPEVS